MLDLFQNSDEHVNKIFGSMIVYIAGYELPFLYYETWGGLFKHLYA